MFYPLCSSLHLPTHRFPYCGAAMTTYHPIASGITAAAFLCCLMIAGGFFVIAIVRRFQQVTMAGRFESRWDDIAARVSNVITYVLLQKRLPRNGYLYSGILHMFIFGAFVVLL